MSQTYSNNVLVSDQVAENADHENAAENVHPVDTIKQKVTLSETYYKFEYGIFEVFSDDVNSVAKNFFKKSKQDTDILPPVTRWVSRDMLSMAIERPPLTVHIAYDDIHFEEDPIHDDICEDCDPEYGCDCGWESDNRQWQSFEYTINIPWTIWFFDFYPPSHSNRKDIRNVKVFCSPTSIQSNSSTLYTLPLPNIYDDNSVCSGNAFLSSILYSNFSAYVIGSINMFWTSRFNNDLVNNIGSLDLGSYRYTREYLEKYSALSMDEVLQANFMPAMTVSSDPKILTFGSFCEIKNNSSNQENILSDTKNRASKFFKDLPNL